MTAKSKALYKVKGRFRKAEKQVYHRKGRVYKGKGMRGSGHQAGEGWGEKKQIDPESSIRVYSKRGKSPSFDQGVRNYKAKAHNKALSQAKLDSYISKHKNYK